MVHDSDGLSSDPIDDITGQLNLWDWIKRRHNQEDKKEAEKSE